MDEENIPDLEWLAAAPKGVRWDRAQEMWEEYQRLRRERAAEIARRLLGIRRGTPVVYEMEPIGVGGAFEAVAVYPYCSISCRNSRRFFRDINFGISHDNFDECRCEGCGGPLPNES